jgi:hypothetical protein
MKTRSDLVLEFSASMHAFTFLRPQVGSGDEDDGRLADTAARNPRGAGGIMEESKLTNAPLPAAPVPGT